MSKYKQFVSGVGIVFLFMVILGCASQIEALVEGLSAEESCCSSYADFSYFELPTDTEVRFSVGPGDKVYVFPAGKSYFKAFRLPVFEKEHSMEVRTYLVGDWIPTAPVFVPAFLFLDKSYVATVDTEIPKFYYDEGIWEGIRWTGLINVPPEAVYVVIHKTPELVYERGAVYVPPSGERPSTPGLPGELRVRFLPRIE